MMMCGIQHVRRPLRSAFTFLEVMIVVVIIGILAAIVIPQFGSATQDARASTLKANLGGVRASIAGYRANAVLAGSPPYPTLSELTTPNTVVQGEFPPNPYNGLMSVQAVSLTQANARSVVNPQSYGWNYFVDNSSNPPVAIFYANAVDPAGLNASGNQIRANEH
ncbi:MAG TPA: prepilin-type N-terminal cleavage/methylation domain-containing protein [Phycisphaerales bacterium]|nr:prepilin-type N-terminal cleavage/methylation domain-containing protein [Phycisphaerales bacterium]